MGAGGLSDAPGAPDQRRSPMDLLTEPAYSEFLKPEFKHANYASSVLQNPNVSAVDEIKTLQLAIGQLEVAIREEVTQKQDNLLAHARRLQASDRSLQRVQHSMDALKLTVKRLKDDINDPFQQMQQRGMQLTNLHVAINSLHVVNHRLKLTSKLRQLMGRDQAQGPMDPMDLAKAARIIRDMDVAASEGDLKGVDVIDRDVEFVESSRAAVTHAARALLRSGLESLSQADVSSALQVFFNFGTLRQIVLDVVTSYGEDVDKAVRAAMDVRQLSGLSSASTGALRGLTGPGTAGKVAEALWKALDEAMRRMHDAAIAIWHLQRVISKKRDPLTLIAFSTVMEEESAESLLDIFWTAAAESLARAAQQANSRRGPVRDSLVHEFPRLSSLLQAMFERVSQVSDAPMTPPAAQAQHRTALLLSVASFQDAFLAASLARVQDAVNTLYPASTRALPSFADVQKCISTLHEEIKGASASHALCALVAIAAGKGLALMAARVHLLAASGQELRSVAGAASPAQLRNIALCSQLNEVHRSFILLLPRLPAGVGEMLHEPLEHVQSQAAEAVLPIFRAASEALEGCILQMHDSDWAAAASAPVMRTSAYMQKLAAQLRLLRTDYLSKFSPPPSPNMTTFSALLVQRLASRTLALFVRHAALVRPISKQGALQLAKDMAELEQEMRQHVYPPDLLGEPYDLLRSFRSLLFMETDAIASSNVLNTLPTTTLLFHLFSRLPDAAKSPHQRTNVSARQYSQWMDSHSQTEILNSIGTAIDAAREAQDGTKHRNVFQLMESLRRR